MAHPDDIEKMARAVLSIRLPRSPEQIQSMIDEINNLLSNVSRFQDDLKKLQEQAKITQELLKKAEEVKLVSEIEKGSLCLTPDIAPSSGIWW